MLLLFRSGWFHFLFGVLILGGAIALVDYSQNDFGKTFSFLGRTAWLNPGLIFWTGLGVLGHLGILIGFTLTGMTFAPKGFARWWFASFQRVYRNLDFLRVVSLALFAGLLVEPFLRFGLFPLLLTEFDEEQALVFLSVVVALVSWTPFTNLLAVFAFAECLWFGYLYQESNNPFAPVIAHGISEFILGLILWKFHTQGMTDQPPPKPEPLVATGSDL